MKYLDFRDPKPQMTKIEIDGEEFDIQLPLDRPVSPARKIIITSAKKELAETILFNYGNMFCSSDNLYVKEIYSALLSDADDYKKTLPEEKDLDPKKPYKIACAFDDYKFNYLTEEEWNEFLSKREAYEKQEQDDRQTKKARQERLQNIGYIDEGENSFAGEYEHRLLNVFSQENISHVDQVHEHMRMLKEKENSALQLFSQISGIVKSEIVDDYYVAEIKKLLDRHEQMVQQYCTFLDGYRKHIQDLFVRGSVRDLELFARFEKLKKDNRKNSLVSKFKFDDTFFPRDYKKIELKETDTVNNENIRSILAALKYDIGGGLVLQDLDSIEHPFLQKFEKSYKQDIKRDILYRSEQYLKTLHPEQEDMFSQLSEEEQLFVKKQIASKVSEDRWNQMIQSEKNQIVRLFSRKKGKLLPLNDDDKSRLKDREKYRAMFGGFHSSMVQECFHISKETLEGRQFEAKKEIIHDFGGFFDDIKLSRFNSYHKVSLWIEKCKTFVYLHKIPRLLEQMSIYQKNFGCAVPLDAIKQKIVKNFSDFYLSLVEKIKNKEQIEYAGFRKNPDPELMIINILNYLKAIRDLIEQLDTSALSVLPSVDQIQSLHAKTYIDHFVFQKIKKEYDSLDASSFSDLHENEKDQIENIFIEKLTKRYIKRLHSCMQEACDIGNTLENGFDPIVVGFEDELLKLGFIYPLNDIIPEAESLGFDSSSDMMAHSDDPIDKEKREDLRKKREKFYVFQRKVVKASTDYVLGHLLNLQKFHPDKILMIKCMKDDYLSYYGDEKDIVIDREAINKVYYKFLKNKIENRLIATRRLMKSPKIKREEYANPYFQYVKIANEIHNFLDHIYLGTGSSFVINGYQKYIEKNNRYAGEYNSCYIDHLSFFGYDMEDFVQNISPEMIQYFDGVFTRMVEQRPQILRLCVQYRLFENGIVGGKLHRMVYENILQHFGKDNVPSQDQTLFAINYLSDKLPDIIWEDFRQDILGGVNVFPFDKDLVVSIIQEFLEKWREGLGHQSELGGNDKPIEIE